MQKRENQYERTAFSWMRTVALSLIVVLYVLKIEHFQISLYFYLAITCFITILLSYARKNKLLLCCTLLTTLVLYCSLSEYVKTYT